MVTKTIEGGNLMDSTLLVRALPWSSPTTWIVLVAGLAFLGIGMRAVADPAGAAAFFGLAVPDEKGRAFVQVFGARNVGLSLLMLALLLLDVRVGVAAIFLAAAGIAALDAWIVTSHTGLAKAAKHFAYVVGLLALGLWLVLHG
jgi:hypothetical protein